MMIVNDENQEIQMLEKNKTKIHFHFLIDDSYIPTPIVVAAVVAYTSVVVVAVAVVA